MLKNIFKNFNAKLLLLILISFLGISVFGNLLLSSNKVFAFNSAPSFTSQQANEIKSNPGKYISFHWGDAESIYLDFNLTGYSGANHLLLFNTDGAVNFLANQNKTYSNDFCANGDSTQININAYKNYHQYGGSSSYTWGDDQAFNIYYNDPNGVDTGCKKITIQPGSGQKFVFFKVNSPINAGFFMKYNSSTISMLDNGTSYATFKLTRSTIPKIYLFLNSTQTCSDRIVVDETGSTPVATLYEFSNSQSAQSAQNQNYSSPSTSNKTPSNAQSIGCPIDSISNNGSDPNLDLANNNSGILSGGSSIAVSIKLPSSSDGLGYNMTSFIQNLNQLKKDQPNSTSTSISNTSSSGPPTAQTPTCESANSGITIGWLLCPIMNWLNSGISDIEGYVKDLLQTHVANISNPASDPYTNALYSAWNVFRNMANIILVVVILVVVFGESIGGGLIDAYSIRKILPRIIIGAILINTSFYIVVALEDVINVIGGGIGALLTDPFKYSGGPAITISTGGSVALTLGITAAIGGALIVNGALAFIGLAALSAFIAMIIVLITLILRQALLVILIVLSPVAFALYILPNTQSVFKKWWDLLFKTLLMYPIIMVFFAMGVIGAYVMHIASYNGDGNFYQILEVIAIILPLFLIPQAFKMAGGAIGSLHGAITGLGHKQFLANMRKQNRQNRINRAMSGGFENKGIGRLYNRIGTGARAGWRGRFGVGERGRAALALDAAAQTEESLKNNHKLAQLRNEDDANAVMALSGGSRAGALEAARELFGSDQARINNAMSRVDAVGLSKANATAALQTMAQNKSRAIGEGRYDLIQNGINRLAGGNGTQAESIAQQFQFLSREAGRGDIGGMWTNKSVQDRATNLQRTMGISREEAMRHAVSLDAMGRMDPASLTRGHAAQTKQFAETAGAIYKAASSPNASPELKVMGAEAASRLLEMNKNLSYASGENQSIVNDAIYAAGVDYSMTRTALIDGVEQQVPVSIEDQLAGGLNWVSNGTQAFNGQELSKMARTYSGDQILPGGQRGPGAES